MAGGITLGRGQSGRRQREPEATQGYRWADLPGDIAQAFGQAGRAGLEGYATALSGVNAEGRTVAGILPMARDERTGERSLAAPRILDLWNTLGGVAGKGGIALGAGPVMRRSAEGLPEQIARMLREGRAAEVTDDMLARLGPNENARLVELYEAGATGMPMPMDEASRIGRAVEMGANVEPTRFPRNDPALDAEAKRQWGIWGRANEAVRDDFAAKREAGGGVGVRRANEIAREELRERRISPREFEDRISELMGLNRNVEFDPALEASAAEARRAYQAAEDARHFTPPGADYHGSPSIGWLEDPAASFDGARTHDLNLAYGQSRAYTSRDPRAASGYARPGASWGNRDVDGSSPGVVPLQVMAKRPLDLDARVNPPEARGILGDAFENLPDDDYFTGRDVWRTLVEDQPSYGDLRIESQLIGGDVSDMLPKTQANAELADMGYDAIRHVDHYNPGGGGKHSVTIPFDNAILRSRFARFDPRLRDNANLLASQAPVSGIGLGDPNRRRLNWREAEDML